MSNMPISYLNTLEGLNKRVEKLEDGGGIKTFKYDMGEPVTLTIGGTPRTINHVVMYDTPNNLISYEGVGYIQYTQKFPTEFGIWLPFPFIFPAGAFNSFAAYNLVVYVKLIDSTGKIHQFESEVDEYDRGNNELKIDNEGHIMGSYTFNNLDTTITADRLTDQPIICGWRSRGLKDTPAFMLFYNYEE